jgi:hypothetical protein
MEIGVWRTGADEDWTGTKATRSFVSLVLVLLSSGEAFGCFHAGTTNQNLRPIHKLFTHFSKIGLAFSSGLGYDSLALERHEC